MVNVKDKNNNFSFIRILAAFFVIHYHAYVLTKNPDSFLGSNFGVLGVSIFFTVSGYLVTQSWVSQPVLKLFLTKRLLRIIPALLICIFLTAFVIGAINTSIPLVKYYTHPETFSYLKNIFLYPIQFSLPGVFLLNPYPDTVNGSLWTLPLEFTLYFTTSVFWIIGFFKKRSNVLLLILLFIILEQIALKNPSYDTSTIFYMYLNLIIRHLIFFFIGSAIFLYKSYLHLNYKTAFLLIIIFIIINSISFNILSYYIFIPYITMFIAFSIPNKLSYLQKFGDPSYGMYIYSFPIQQTFINFFPGIQPLSLSLLTFTVSIIIGFISWYIIESPMLKIKRYLN